MKIIGPVRKSVAAAIRRAARQEEWSVTSRGAGGKILISRKPHWNGLSVEIQFSQNGWVQQEGWQKSFEHDSCGACDWDNPECFDSLAAILSSFGIRFQLEE